MNRRSFKSIPPDLIQVPVRRFERFDPKIHKPWQRCGYLGFKDYVEIERYVTKDGVSRVNPAYLNATYQLEYLTVHTYDRNPDPE